MKITAETIERLILEELENVTKTGASTERKQELLIKLQKATRKRVDKLERQVATLMAIIREKVPVQDRARLRNTAVSTMPPQSPLQEKKQQIRSIIEQEIQNVLSESTMDGDFDCNDLSDIPDPSGRYDAMTEQQLLKVMCCPPHWKVYYHASMELDSRGYKGPRPKLRAPAERKEAGIDC